MLMPLTSTLRAATSCVLRLTTIGALSRAASAVPLTVNEITAAPTALSLISGLRSDVVPQPMPFTPSVEVNQARQAAWSDSDDACCGYRIHDTISAWSGCSLRSGTC